MIKKPATKSIAFRVPFIIVLVLLLGIGGTIIYYVVSLNSTIQASKEREIRDEASIMFTSIKNTMLAGEAPIAVSLFSDLARNLTGTTIRLYRRDGMPAFSDNSTVAEVNGHLGRERFSGNDEFSAGKKAGGEHFARAVSSVSDVIHGARDDTGRFLVIHKVLINQPVCSRCHGLDHVVRGVIEIRNPMDEVYRASTRNIVVSAILYALVVLLLTSIIVVYLRRVIINRVFTLSRVVQGVGEGDFISRVTVVNDDEIGSLGDSINGMIDGLHERFKLSRFVSRSTLDHIQEQGDIALGGTRKNLTVLFSDIRGFTNYSEEREPEEVLDTLNEVMTMQAGIIAKHQGDIDKFVGDEIMAVFEGDDMAYRAIRAAEEIRDTMKSMNAEKEIPLYVGIGINSGDMIAGNMGSDERIDRTVIGDAVNLGARLCSIAGKNTIVLSEAAYRLVEGNCIVKKHPPVRVKGKTQPVSIYTLRKTT